MNIVSFVLKYKLEIIVFVSGAAVMALEVIGSRIVSPYIGTSTIIWTSLIGIILLALSIGYWIGGKYADTHASYERLSTLFFYSSLLVSYVLLAEYISPIIAEMIPDIRISALILGIVIFCPSILLLGMVSPLAARLRLNELTHAGETVGRLYAISTIGSIVGTFLGGFILISFFSSRTIVFSIALALALLSLASHQSKKIYIRTLGAIVLAACMLFIVSSPIQTIFPQTIKEIESSYSRMWIMDSAEAHSPTRYLTNTIFGYQSSADITNHATLTAPYTRTIATMIEAAGSRPMNVLTLGAGAYSLPKYIEAVYPGTQQTIVEIDPVMTDIAKTHFAFSPTASMDIRHEDARIFVNTHASTNATYDVIIADAYSSSLSVPFHLTTYEMMDGLADMLSEDGALYMNVISATSGNNSDLFWSLVKTLRMHFPHVAAHRVHPERAPSSVQNSIIVASHSPLPRYELRGNIDMPQEATDMPGIVLRDSFAPVERFTAGFHTGR